MEYTHPARRLIAAVSLAVFVSACIRTWHASPIPDVLVAEPLPSPVRVTTADSLRLVLDGAARSGDSIAGWLANARAVQLDTSGLVVISVRDIVGLEVRRVAVGPTVLVTVLAVVAVPIGLMALLVALGGGINTNFGGWWGGR